MILLEGSASRNAAHHRRFRLCRVRMGTTGSCPCPVRTPTRARTSAERQGDALFDIAAFFNKNHGGNERPRNLPNVTLSADASTVVTDHPEGVNVDTQRPMSSACTDTYLCDCRIHVILRNADGSPHSFGRTTRTVPSRLFKQVAARDGGCREPGCDRPVKWTDAHHIVHWSLGGTTSSITNTPPSSQGVGFVSVDRSESSQRLTDCCHGDCASGD